MTGTGQDDYDGIQYDTFNGPRAAYRCVLCGETYPRGERLNRYNECAECVDYAEQGWGF